MKSLDENKVLASMAVARNGIDRLIVKIGNNYANLEKATFKGNKYELLVTRKGTKVLFYDSDGKKVDEVETAPPEPKSNKSNKKAEEKEKGTDESQ